MLNVECSMLNVELESGALALNIQHSTFNIQHFASFFRPPFTGDLA